MLIAKNRKLDLREVFSYSLRSYPRALASDSGGLNKTAKSKLLHVLESEANQPLVDVIPQQCTTIIDAMALLQMLSVKDIPGTFAQLADQVLKKVIHIARYNNSERVDFVSDRYPVVSTKNAERINRAASGTQSVTILNGRESSMPVEEVLECGSKQRTANCIFGKAMEIAPALCTGTLKQIVCDMFQLLYML